MVGPLDAFGGGDELRRQTQVQAVCALFAVASQTELARAGDINLDDAVSALA